MSLNNPLKLMLCASVLLPNLVLAEELDFSNMTQQDAVRAAQQACSQEGQTAFDTETCLDEKISLLTKRIELQKKYLEAIGVNNRLAGQTEKSASGIQSAPMSEQSPHAGTDLYADRIVGRVGALKAGLVIRGNRYELAKGESAKGYLVKEITRDFVLVQSLDLSEEPIKLQVLDTMD